MTTPTKSQSVGVISDTHGLLRPEAVAAREGVDVIAHAGDVGKPEALAPSTRSESSSSRSDPRRNA